MNELLKLREIIKQLRAWGHPLEELRFASGPFSELRRALAGSLKAGAEWNLCSINAQDCFEFRLDGVRIVADIRIDFTRQFIDGPSLRERLDGINGLKYEVKGERFPEFDSLRYLTEYPGKCVDGKEPEEGKLVCPPADLNAWLGQPVIVRLLGPERRTETGILVGAHFAEDWFTLCVPKLPNTIQVGGEYPRLETYAISHILHIEQGELT